jgi:hypothetical protein
MSMGATPLCWLNCSARWVTRRRSSARISSETATSSCRPCRGSMSSLATSEKELSYFDTDRLNIRSIFSLVASQHDWLA